MLPTDDVRTFRMSNTVLGNGFVEVISDHGLLRYPCQKKRRWGMEEISPWWFRHSVEAEESVDWYIVIDFTFVEAEIGQLRLEMPGTLL